MLAPIIKTPAAKVRNKIWGNLHNVENHPTPIKLIKGRHVALAPAENKNCIKYLDPITSALLDGITSDC
jgi:hypothetical protein